MKIVILDSYALNPGDLSWQTIQALGEVVIYDRTPPEKIVERIGDATIVLTNKVEFNRELLAQLPHVKYIGVMASGYNIIDVEAARECGIIVTNVPNYSTPTVAQHVFALLLDHIVKVNYHDQLIKQNAWAKAPDFCFYDRSFYELHDKTIGIVGFGNIGQAVANIASAFGMSILIYDKGKVEKHPLGQKVTLEDLYTHSDIITLHLPLKEDTHHLIDSKALAMMKKEALLINTARAPLINKDDLLDALNNDVIHMFLSDVFYQEPPALDDPLIMHPKTIFTGHMAWGSKEARQRCLAIIESNIQGFINNDVVNQVN